MGSRAFPPPFQGSPVVAGRPRVPLRFTLGYGSRRRFAAHEICDVGDPQRGAPYARRAIFGRVSQLARHASLMQLPEIFDQHDVGLQWLQLAE